MSAYFPTTIWDGDSPNRNSDNGTQSAPDHRDWTQLISEIIATQDYILNQNIDLGERTIYFGLTPEASLSYSSSIITWNLVESGTNLLQIGDGTNYFQIDSTGVITLIGTAKRKLTMRPEFDYITQVAHSKPAQVAVGVYKGYLFPVYNNDNEELFYDIRVPFRWDEESDLLICMIVALEDVEDIGDTFKFRCSWEHTTFDGTILTTSNDVDVQKTITSGHTAQYSIYHIHFIIDYDIDGPGNEMKHEDLIGFRIRRIASSGTKIDNKIIVLNTVVDFQIDKLYNTWIRA